MNGVRSPWLLWLLPAVAAWMSMGLAAEPAPGPAAAGIAPAGSGEADPPSVRGTLAPPDLLDGLGRLGPPPVVPSVLFDEHAHLPALLWPEARYRRRFGDWELDVRGASSAATGDRPWSRGVPASSAALSLTWRYHGLLHGTVRPVVGVSAFASQAAVPQHWSLRHDALWSLGLAPSAGLEVVHRGVGVGWRAALPVGLYQSTPDGFYHPQLMGRRQPDWGRFFQGVIQNMYLIWEED